MSAAFGERLKDVVLFGSYARGDAHEGSDVDVLVVIDGLSTDEIAKVSDAATATALETGTPLAPLPLSSAGLQVMREQGRALALDIDREGARL